MNDAARQALQVETEFLAGVATNFKRAQGRQLPGQTWQLVDQDQSEQLRAVMLRRGLADRGLLSRLPRNRRKVLHGYKRAWWLLGKRRTAVAIGSFFAPLEHYLPPAAGAADTPAPPRPVDLPELAEHVRSLLVDTKTPHVIGVCSPSGFTPEARTASTLPNVTLVLVEPSGDGGWTVTAVGDQADKSICEIFDPEPLRRKMQRVRREIDRRSADLLTSGLSAATIQQASGLDAEIVAAGLEQAADADPELHLSRKADGLLLFRGAPSVPAENATMSIPDWINQLFGRKGDETKKINHLSERRAALAQRRDRIYEDITKLEQTEGDLLEQGRTNKSQTVRRRVASQLAQVRKDISRFNATASMLGKQVDIVSTHIHNLTLIQQGQVARMPDAEEITTDAVRAEEMLESLKADADLVGSLDTGVDEILASDEERAILAEFDAEFDAAGAEDGPARRNAEQPSPAESTPTPESVQPEPQKPEPEAD